MQQLDRGKRLGRAYLILAVIGASLGTALDAIHTNFGATSYTSPAFAKAALWVPLLFAFAYSAAIARPLLDRASRPAAWQALLGVSLFIAAYWLSVAPIPWGARAAIIGGIFAVSWYVCDRTRAGVIVALIGAVCGPAVEVVLVGAGTFVHHETLALGIPGWLPFLYLTAGPGLGTLAQWLVTRGAIEYSEEPARAALAKEAR